MEITVERVSPHGFMADGKWINADKKCGIDFKAKFHPGDVVKLTTNSAGFITDAVVVTAAPPKPEKPAWKGGSSKSSEFRTTEQIIRSVAAEAAFESPVLSEQTKEMSKEQAVQFTLDVAKTIANYIEKGA